MRWPNNFFLGITMWWIKLVVFLLLFVPVVAAQNKVVVIPFFDSSSNDQFITMRDYGAPGNCVHTYRGNSSGEFRDPLIEITTSPVSTRWKHFDSEGNVYIDFVIYDNGFLDNLSGNYYAFDQPVYGFLPPGQKKVGDSWADGYIGTCYNAAGTITDIRSWAKTYTLISFEDVVINQVNYQDCIKLAQDEGHRNNIAWYAKGIGLVKRVYSNLGGAYFFELTSFTCE